MAKGDLLPILGSTVAPFRDSHSHPIPERDSDGFPPGKDDDIRYLLATPICCAMAVPSPVLCSCHICLTLPRRALVCLAFPSCALALPVVVLFFVCLFLVITHFLIPFQAARDAFFVLHRWQGGASERLDEASPPLDPRHAHIQPPPSPPPRFCPAALVVVVIVLLVVVGVVSGVVDDWSTGSSSAESRSDMETMCCHLWMVSR
mmetsp:Transcript_6892/g.15711  ORF Transcript_6892/g.15711 Transcript_6892/m.15711 type:complete len:204 (-) Transcript_6892:239-850(-)